jgi:hypothetical protein
VSRAGVLPLAQARVARVADELCEVTAPNYVSNWQD